MNYISTLTLGHEFDQVLELIPQKFNYAIITSGCPAGLDHELLRNAASEIELAAFCEWRFFHEQRHRITCEPRNETMEQACIICFDHWIWGYTIHQWGLHAPGLTSTNAMIPHLIPRIWECISGDQNT